MTFSSILVLTAFLVFALLTPSQSQAQQMYGLFMIVKGEVTFQNPNVQKEKAKVGSKVFEGATISTEKDSRAKIVMSDRNVFNLSPDSKLTIQKYENAGAGKKNVSMSLEEGKVRVNVEQKYNGNSEKFLLKTPTVTAGVRGTQFLAAYNSMTKVSQVVTFKGSVTMTSFAANGQPLSTVIVEKGQSSTAGANQPPETPKALPKDEIKELDRSSSSAGASEKKSEQASGSGEGIDSKDKNEKEEPKLTNTKDLDTDTAKEIKVINGEGVNSAPLQPPPYVPINVPVTPDTVKNPVQQKNTNTKVIIHVQ